MPIANGHAACFLVVISYNHHTYALEIHQYLLYCMDLKMLMDF